MTRQGRSWLPYVLLALAILLLALSEAGTLGPVVNLTSYIFAPLERGVAGFVRVVGELSQTVREVRELQQQIESYQSENAALRVENIRLQEQYVAENQQLRLLLNFSEENPTYALVGANVVERGCEVYPCAEVIGVDNNPYLRYFIINTGSRDGVAVGMPAVTGGAVFAGRVARVSRQQTFVQLVNDPDSQTAAMLQGSRVSGIVEGRPDGSLVMTQILPDEIVEEGEIVITSGLGGLLPKGLVIGQVESVSYQEASLFQEAIIRPALDLRRVEVLLIITDFPRSTSPAPLEEP